MSDARHRTLAQRAIKTRKRKKVLIITILADPHLIIQRRGHQSIIDSQISSHPQERRYPTTEMEFRLQQFGPRLVIRCRGPKLIFLIGRRLQAQVWHYDTMEFAMLALHGGSIRHGLEWLWRHKTTKLRLQHTQSLARLQHTQPLLQLQRTQPLIRLQCTQPLLRLQCTQSLLRLQRTQSIIHLGPCTYIHKHYR